MVDGQLDLFSLTFIEEVKNISEVAIKEEMIPSSKKRGRKTINEMTINTQTDVVDTDMPTEEKEPSLPNETTQAITPDVKQGEMKKATYSEQNQKEVIELRRSPAVKKGDIVKVQNPIDNDPASEGYIASFKGKKGIVFDIKEVSNPSHHRYQYNVWVLFDEKTKEIGIFYDLELKRIEDNM
jgi:hypothetical protein